LRSSVWLDRSILETIEGHVSRGSPKAKVIV